jgi:hypothetical protein
MSLYELHCCSPVPFSPKPNTNPWNEVVEFTLTATSFDEWSGQDVSGSASVLLAVNTPPVSGRCYAEPRSGVALQTKFSIMCQVRYHDAEINTGTKDKTRDEDETIMTKTRL